ncbi:MAG: GGDEF domain-containing protein [Pseudomonadota bacterium]
MRISQQTPFEELLANANRSMIEEHHRGEDRVQNLETALRERERLAEELQTAFERLAQLAYFDPLTSLMNRRRFDELFLTEIARHSRSGQPLSVLLVDLDGFKHVNDTYGHLLGDEVLRRAAQTVKRTLRISDVAARIGGDELCVLLPDTAVEGGKVAAARLCQAVADLRFAGALAAVRVSVSIGGSSWSGSYSREINLEAIHDRLIDTADKALYFSKNNGRNQASWIQIK